MLIAIASSKHIMFLSVFLSSTSFKASKTAAQCIFEYRLRVTLQRVNYRKLYVNGEAGTIHLANSLGSIQVN